MYKAVKIKKRLLFCKYDKLSYIKYNVKVKNKIYGFSSNYININNIININNTSKYVYYKFMLMVNTIYKLYNKVIMYKNKINNKIYINNSCYNNVYILTLNFKRNRFFPYFYLNNNKNILFNLSLGILSRRFSSKKSFLKSKNSYLMVSIFIRRMLVYSLNNNKFLYLFIKKTPKYFRDIMSTIMSNSNSIYKHPFKDLIVNDKLKKINFNFKYINFINNKSLGAIKKKQRGRLKRKILKRINLYNNIAD